MTIHKHCRGINTNGSLDVDDYYTKSQINSQMNTKSDKNVTANNSLSNLSAAGQMIIDSANETISNCILEIPQNIKVTLENNVLTLNSGSVLTDSGATYQTITINVDRTLSLNDNGTFMIFSTTNGILTREPLTRCVSGTIDSLAGIAWHIWFDITNKEVFEYGSDGTTGGHRTYPFCIIEVKDGVASFAKDSNGNDMIFNGVGFIGHHIFRLPNVSGYTGEGFTSDRKLNSNFYSPQNLLIQEMNVGAAAVGKRAIGFQAATKMNYIEVDTVAESPAHQHIAWVNTYVREQNQMWLWTGAVLTKYHESPLVYYGYNGTTVTDFTIRQPYEGARCLLTDEIEEEVATKQADVTTLTGYDATKTQTLKNVSGILTWVDDE